MSKSTRKRLRTLRNSSQKLKNELSVEREGWGFHSDVISPEDLYKSQPIFQAPTTKYEGLSLHERNLIVLEAAKNIFHLSKSNWSNIKRNISGEQVKELYQIIADIWHPSMDFDSVLPAPSQELRALYLGDIDANFVSRNIFRFSLYADTIYIIDPFHNPHIFIDEFNPLVHPNKFKVDTLKILYFLLQVGFWIEAGLVLLVPNPADFNPHFRLSAFNSAIKRTKNLTLSKAEMEELAQSSREDFLRFHNNIPRSIWEEEVREFDPNVTKEILDEIEKQIEQKKINDPLSLEQSPEILSGQLTTGRAGLNLETALFLSEGIGAFPYTNLKMRWRELLSVRRNLSEEARIWSPLTKGFQDLDFKFLDKVDSKFAFEMRDTGRLESFRIFLRRIWKTLNSNEQVKNADNVAKEYREELNDEYRKAQAEWKQINIDLIKWVGSSFTVASAVASGSLVLAPPVALTAVGIAIFKLIESNMQKSQFRLKNPMSVFIDLDKHKPRFKSF